MILIIQHVLATLHSYRLLSTSFTTSVSIGVGVGVVGSGSSSITLGCFSMYISATCLLFLQHFTQGMKNPRKPAAARKLPAITNDIV